MTLLPAASSSAKRPFWILPVIIISEFAGTSLWFATNAIFPDLEKSLQLGSDVVGIVTSAIQLGFIAGTLCFAFFTVADRFSPRMIFAICSFAGALFNIGILSFSHSFSSVLALRFFTGVCLAGIYPVGMKIASGWYREGLGNALGFLVGALVLGTSLPHLLKSVGQGMPWENVTIAISSAAVVGGVLMLLFVPDGPYLLKGTPFNSKALALIFQSKKLRSAAFGYFGHMWELYTFYAFLPVVLSAYGTLHHLSLDTSFWTFVVIAAGVVGCGAGGLLSEKAGSARVASLQLFCSGLCCLCSPLMFNGSVEIFLGLFVFWGIVVVGDSPQFSALVAKFAPEELVGSALTITNSIGFTITIISIEVVSYASRIVGEKYLFFLLAIGPALGLLSMVSFFRKHRA